jgi:hypothetical protein
MSDMRCPKCNYEGAPRSRIQHWFVIVGLLFFGYNLFLIVSAPRPADAAPFGFTLSLVCFIALIIYGLKEYCPKCGNKQIVKK